MTGYNSQTTKGDYKLQFETDDYDKFRYVEETARRCVDNRHIEVCDPVVHAHWIYRGNEHYSLCDWYEHFECSRCRRKVKLSSKGEIEDLPYCNCGAKMDEEVKQ